MGEGLEAGIVAPLGVALEQRHGLLVGLGLIVVVRILRVADARHDLEARGLVEVCRLSPHAYNQPADIDRFLGWFS